MAAAPRVPDGLTDCIPAIAVAARQVDRSGAHIALVDGANLRIVHADGWDGFFAGQKLPAHICAQLCKDATDCRGTALMALVKANGRGNALKLPYERLDALQFTATPGDDIGQEASMHETESSGPMSSPGAKEIADPVPEAARDAVPEAARDAVADPVPEGED